MEQKEVEFKKSEVSKDKLTYEQLENVCHQLSEQSRTLYQKLQEASMENFFKRLDYLFKVVDNAIAFTSRGYQDFISKCIEEIVSSMQIPEPAEEETKSEE